MRQQIPTRVKPISNRQRQRNMDKAIQAAEEIVQQAEAQVAHARFLVCAVLAQKGGEIEVTKGTLEQLMGPEGQGLGKVGYTAIPVMEDGKHVGMIVRLVTGEEPQDGIADEPPLVTLE